MKEELMNNLIEKYKSGLTSLEEEKTLFDSDAITDKSIQKLVTFIKKTKKQAPENFNEKLWVSFEEKTKKPNKYRIGLISAAASLALILSIYMSNNNSNELTIGEKEALLKEAKSMFLATNEEAKYDVVVENELVVVYTKLE